MDRFVANYSTSKEFIKNFLDGYLRSPKETGNYHDSNYYEKIKYICILLINSDVEIYHPSCFLLY